MERRSPPDLIDKEFFEKKKIFSKGIKTEKFTKKEGK